MRTVAMKSQYQTIALASIHESTANPRRTFDEIKLTELADSLRTQGPHPADHGQAQQRRL
jgi:ParB-like chromosome segregation protein Spo0J